jgi:hypothetical protein
MKRYWRILFAAFLLGLSGLFYFAHFYLFRDLRHIVDYFLTDIAFVPISVLFVTLILERMLEAKQKETLKHKLNMALGVFFSEVGQPLIKILESYQKANPGLTNHLQIKSDWTRKDFLAARAFVARLSYVTHSKKTDLVVLRDFLSAKRAFLLGLLENPNLLEHEEITDMLWAIFHLAEELGARKNLAGLAENDQEHLSGDLKRAYSQLIFEWLSYMQHLKTDYPYLYSLAVRMNPFSPTAAAEIS